MRDIPATWMRGGTSKCWVFDRSDLSVPGRTTDDVLLRLYGSPDPRQIDGVGGATSTTSKAVVLSPSLRDDVDVEYSFAQVGITDGRVDWSSNCGNCSAVIGPYALRRGWVAPRGETTEVRVRNTNTDQLIVIEVPTPGGRLAAEDDAEGLDAGPGVRLWFVDPVGRTTGALLPTGHAVDRVDGVDVSLVDAGAPVVLVPAEAVDLTGSESPAVLERRQGLLERLDTLRRAAAVRMGLAAAPADASRAVPKLAVVAAGTSGRSDLTIRMLSMGRPHPALAVTGSIALTMAARHGGTVLDGLTAGDDAFLRLEHPSGLVTTEFAEREGLPAVAVRRTTRRLAEAQLALPDVVRMPSTVYAA